MYILVNSIIIYNGLLLDAAEAMSPMIKYNTISEEQVTIVALDKKSPSFLLAQTGESK